MAEGNDPGTTPAVPVNTFVGGGIEQNIDQQKGFQNDLIAQQGQGVRALYDRTGASAKDVLQSQLSAAGGNPTARTALFQSYVDDAKAGEARSAQSVQRQAALGNMFMDQTKAAIPLYAKNVDATTEAMRLQFEERRRKEEQNYQLQRAQLAASSYRKKELTPEEEGEAQARKELAYYAVKDPDGLDKNNPKYKAGSGEKTVAQAIRDKSFEKQKDFNTVSSDLGLPSWQFMTSRYRGLEDDAASLQRVINEEALKTGVTATTFEGLYSLILNELDTNPDLLSSEGERLYLFDYLMGANAGRWGAKPEDWNFDPKKYLNITDRPPGVRDYASAGMVDGQGLPIIPAKTVSGVYPK